MKNYVFGVYLLNNEQIFGNIDTIINKISENKDFINSIKIDFIKQCFGYKTDLKEMTKNCKIIISDGCNYSKEDFKLKIILKYTPSNVEDQKDSIESKDYEGYVHLQKINYAIAIFDPYYPEYGYNQIRGVANTLEQVDELILTFQNYSNFSTFYMDYKILDLTNKKIFSRNSKFDDNSKEFLPCQNKEMPIRYWYSSGEGRSYFEMEAITLKEMLKKIKDITQSLGKTGFYQEIRKIKRFYGFTYLESIKLGFNDKYEEIKENREYFDVLNRKSVYFTNKNFIVK